MQRQFLRRIRKKTDYKQRLAILKSGLPRIVVRKSLNNIHMQVIIYDKKGDRTILEDSSGNLRKLGWKGHCGNTSAAYLIGYMLGKRIAAKGIGKAVLDIGLQTSTKENSLYAALKGVQDAGVDVSSGNVVPDESKIKGKHIAEYARKLKSESREKFEKQFSAYIKNNLDPEDMEKHFDEIKSKIA